MGVGMRVAAEGDPTARDSATRTRGSVARGSGVRGSDVRGSGVRPACVRKDVERPAEDWPPAKHALCALGLLGMFLLRWLTSAYVFPLYDERAAWLRDVAVVASALALAGAAVAFLHGRRARSGARLIGVTGACLVAGLILFIWPLRGGPLATLAVGAILLDVGSCFVCVLVCLVCVGMPLRRLAVSVACAYAVAYLARVPLASLDGGLGVAVFAVCALVTLGICALFALSDRPAFELAAADASPLEVAATRPGSLLPLGHRLYLLLCAFEVVYGFAMTVGALGDGETFSVPVAACLVAICLLALAPRLVASPDWLFVASVLAVLAGLLARQVTGDAAGVAGAAALALGSGAFQVLAFFVLVAIGGRNRRNGFAVVTWGLAAMSAGVVVGANLGKAYGAWAGSMTPNGSLADAVAIFLLVALVLVLMSGFSLRQTLGEVEDVAEPVAAPTDEDAVHEGCRRLGERYGLTQREREILPLLARGRNSPYIQEELGISYNTVRTHVRHIYAKCGFHTQQELIDAVERG